MSALTRRISSWPVRALAAILILAVRIYQVTISPILAFAGPVCRFHPSCSQYLIDAIRKYGLFQGLRKGIARFLRCHPWHPGGDDPA